MSINPHRVSETFRNRRTVSPDEQASLRRIVWSDGRITSEEAAELFSMNDEIEPANEWTDFFVEAVCDYLIGRGEPRGYVTEADADWLIHQIARDDRVDTHAELELIVRLFERALFVPAKLKRHALSTIEQIVLTGAGATRRGGDISPGRIDEAETGLLRRLIFAPGSDGPARVSRSEAEMLFRLKDATLGSSNCEEWPRLFVQGVANHLMAHQAAIGVSRDVAQRWNNLAAPPSADFGARGRAPQSIFELIFGSDEERGIAAHDASVARDAAITPDECEWLDRFLKADGARDPLEEALLRFLEKEGAMPRG